MKRDLYAEPDTTTRFLTDGRNFIWVHVNDDGFVSAFSRHGDNAPYKILDAVADAFDTDIVSEYWPQFWGFDTQEEWDAWRMEDSRKADEENKEKFYIEVLKFLRGEPNVMAPGTIWMCKAEIAKTLVDKDPSFLLPGNKDKLRNEIRSIFEREYGLKVTLDPQEIALADMIATHEDDLPRA